MHGLRHLRGDLPGKEQEPKRGSRRSTWQPQPPLRVPERENWDFFLSIPELDRRRIKPGDDSPAADAGAAVRILRRLLGLRRNAVPEAAFAAVRGPGADRERHRLLFDLRRQLPTTPWAKNADGRGPAWSNSLFEDNAEFGLGFRLSIDKQTEFARELFVSLREFGWRRTCFGYPFCDTEGRSRHLRAAAARQPAEREVYKG